MAKITDIHMIGNRSRTQLTDRVLGAAEIFMGFRRDLVAIEGTRCSRVLY